MSQTALLVIDFINDLVQPNNKIAVQLNLFRITMSSKKLIQRFRYLEIIIISLSL